MFRQAHTRTPAARGGSHNRQIATDTQCSGASGTCSGHPYCGGSCAGRWHCAAAALRSEEHTSELQSLMRISYAVFCLKKQTATSPQPTSKNQTTPEQTIHKQTHNPYTDIIMHIK